MREAILRHTEEEERKCLEKLEKDVSGDPVAKTTSSQCTGPRFNPW